MSCILIVDDHPVYREGLAQLIDRQSDFDVCRAVEDPLEAMRSLRDKPVDIVVVDLTLKRGSGLALVKSIRAEWSDLPILVLSMHDEKTHAERLFRAGANGYVMKDRPWKDLLSALRRVTRGQFAFSAEVTRELLEGQRRDRGAGVAGLSDRELDVFELMGRGLRIREVGDRLGISHKTVESHVASVKRKLGIEHANELVYRATLWAASREE